MKPSTTRTLGYLAVSLLALMIIGARASRTAPVVAEQAPPPVSMVTAPMLPSDPGKLDFARALPGGVAVMPPGPSSPLEPAGIYGRVTNNGLLAASIALALRQYDASSETTVATTITDGNGDYVFSGVPTLPSGYRYYVRYGPNGTDPNYVAVWFGPDITAYTAGSSQPGGVFDIADIKLQAPAGNATLPFPITYRWTTRAVPTDDYMVHLFKEDKSVFWNSAHVGYADHLIQTSLPSGMIYNQKYLWHPVAFMGANGLGISYYARWITFLPAGTAKLVYLPLIHKMLPPATPTPALTPPSCDPYEPNDSRATAWGPLVSGQTYQARLCQGDHEDDYYLNALPSQPLVVTISLPAALVGYTNFWIYYDESSEAIDGCGRGPITNGNETITCPIKFAGRYLIQMYTDNENLYFDNSQYYTLRATFAVPGSNPTPTLTPVAASRTLNAVADAVVLEGYPSSNAGSTGDMWAGYDNGTLNPNGRIVRSLIKFDLSSLPAHATVQNAKLRVFYGGYRDYANHVSTITAYRIVNDWTEGAVTWNNKPGSGTAYGSVAIAANQNWGWRELDVQVLVQGWVNRSIPNQGVMLRGPEASGADASYRLFSTREGPYPPQLVINYLAAGAASQPAAVQTPAPAGPSLSEYLNGSQ